jgi:hypothetical protein
MDRKDLTRALRDRGIKTASLRLLQRTDAGPTCGLAVADEDDGDEGLDADGMDVRPPLWRLVRELADRTGYWPLLTHEQELVEGEGLFAEPHFRRPRTTASIVEASLGVDAATWLARRFTAVTDEHFDDEYLGTWPEDADPHDPEGQAEFSGALPPEDMFTLWQPKEACLVLVPATTSWEVPAVLQFDPGNAQVLPEVHVAVLRRWQDLYGAEIVGMAHDTLELYVPHPPRDQETARALAREHFAYCTDRVYQEAGTLEELAAMLYCRPAWRFWWD